MNRFVLTPLAIGLALAAASAPFVSVRAQQGADYYNGRTVTYIVATAAGGGYDYYGRLTAKFMGNYLPGSTFVVRNMPGAGHIIGANYIYNARGDGLTIGTFNTGLIYSQLVKSEGIKFDLTKMSWIGKASSDPRVLVTDIRSPYKTLSDLRNAENIHFAANGVGSAAYVLTKLLINALQLPAKVLVGYDGNDDQMAMRRGEIQAVIGARSSHEPFVKNGYGRFVFQIGGSESDVPQLSDLLREDNLKVKSLVALVRSQSEIQRLAAGPPEIPADRLSALRTAYRMAMEDPALDAEAVKVGRPVEPAYGEEVAIMVKEALSQPTESIALLTSTLSEQPSLVMVEGALLQVVDKGREIVFDGPDGKQVKAQPSGTRTSIKVGGKSVKRDALVAGMSCAISYKPGGDNEPTTIDCK